MQANTPGFIKRWMRHLRSLPSQHELTGKDYDMFAAILTSAVARDNTATSAWSSAASLRCPDGRKRLPPEISRAGSNMHSTYSDAATTATAVQSKHFKRQKVDEVDEEYSMACGSWLVASPEE